MKFHENLITSPVLIINHQIANWLCNILKLRPQNGWESKKNPGWNGKAIDPNLGGGSQWVPRQPRSELFRAVRQVDQVLHLLKAILAR